MKFNRSRFSLLALLPAMFLLAIVLVMRPDLGMAKDFYKMSTLSPGSTPYVVSTAFIQSARKYAGMDIQLNAQGLAHWRRISGHG